MPHTDLSVAHALVKAGNVRATHTAEKCGAALNFNFDDMVAVVLSLTRKHFYKSMTAYADHTTWHDVYKVMLDDVDLYIKLIVSDGVLIVSFKNI